MIRPLISSLILFGFCASNAGAQDAGKIYCRVGQSTMSATGELRMEKEFIFDVSQLRGAGAGRSENLGDVGRFKANLNLYVADRENPSQLTIQFDEQTGDRGAIVLASTDLRKDELTKLIYRAAGDDHLLAAVCAYTTDEQIRRADQGH